MSRRLALAFTIAVASCGTPAGSGPPPCMTVYAGMCGGACSGDAQCPMGQYCLSSRCTADCAPGARTCPNGQYCNPNGRCLVLPDAAPADTGMIGDACASINVQLARRTATLMLLIDQSSSMTARFGNTTRWNAIRSTLVDPTTGVVRALQAEVSFGLAMYSSRNGSSGGTCPMLQPPLMAALNNYDAIARAMNMSMPIDDTPTPESVAAAARLLMVIAPDEDPGNRAIVLATDGEPDTCADPDAQSDPSRQAAARALSVAAVRAAFAQGLRTYVISVGSEVSQAHLQQLADAGAGAAAARYYQALDPAALTAAFHAITAGVRSCVFRLNGRVDPVSAALGDVRLDGMRLIYGGPDGWHLRALNEIELSGTACERARTTGSTLSAEFPCNVVTPG